ncbi:MAG: WD40 repeat domain-containing protein, partial [Phycisphaerales bacterium]|nr:WD40 repeat domain-containing protein [Phycisphaerales bacterium]
RDSTFYVLRKTLRRYRGLVAAAALFAVALAAFSVYAYVQSERNRHLAISESAARVVADAARKSAETAQKRADESAQQLRRELAISRIERGRLSARAGNEADAERVLWSEFLQYPDSTDAYWALWELYQRHPWIASVNALEGSATAASIRPDSAEFAVASADGCIYVASLPLLENLRRIPAHSAEIRTIAYSTDGAIAASGSQDGGVTIWSAESWEPIREICASADAIRGLTFSPDGTRLVSVDHGGWIRIHDVSTGELLHGARDHSTTAYRAVFSPDGRFLATSGADARVVIRDAQSLVPVNRIRSSTGSIVSALFSPNGAYYVGATDRRVIGWNAVTGEADQLMYSPNGAISSLAFSPDGRWLAVGGYWRIDFWNYAQQEREYHISTGQTVATCDITPDGRWLAMSSGKMIRVWEMNRRPGTMDFPSDKERTVVAITPDGSLVATGDLTGAAYLWNGRTGELLQQWQAHKGRVRSIEFHPTQPLLLTSASDDRRLFVWDLRTGKRVREFHSYAPNTAQSFDVSPDGTRVALADRDWTFCIVDFETGETIHKLVRTGFECVAIHFSHDGKRVVCATRDTYPRAHPPRVFDVETGRKLLELDSNASSQQWTFAFSADDSLIASGDWDRSVNLFDAHTGERIAAMIGHGGLVLNVKYHPLYPHLLFSTAGDGALCVWDTRTRRNLVSIEPFNGWEVMNLAFTADGAAMIASGMYGGTRVWDMGYFDRHIAGNLEFMHDRLKDSLPEPARMDALREWSRDVMKLPWPRLGAFANPPTTHKSSARWNVSPEAIRDWPKPEPTTAPALQ